MHRILIFNVNWLGDVLFSTAVIRNIRKNLPDSFIACVIPKRCLAVLEGNPYLNEIIIFDEKSSHKSTLEKLRFVQSLKKKDFDAVFLLHRSFTRALIARLCGIPERIGHFTRKRSFLLTKKIIPPGKDSLHRIDYYLDIIEKAGFKIFDRYTEFFVSEADREFIEEFLKTKGIVKERFLAGINPGGNWLSKRWPKEYWAELADRLIEELGMDVIITGNTSDIGLVTEIQGLMKNTAFVAAGALTLKQFAALCKRLDLFISADTGPLHIANAVVAKKIIAVFGPTDPLITGLFPADNVILIKKDIGCKIPCYKLDCPDNRCMKAISVGDIFEESKKVKSK